MTPADARWERGSALAGVVFVALAVLWALLRLDVPDISAPNDEISSFFEDDGNRIRLIIAALALAVGGLLFLWFLSGLRARLRRGEEGRGELSTLAFAGGLSMAAILFVKNAVQMAVPSALEFSDTFELDPELPKLFGSVSYWLLVQEALAGGLMVGAASLVVLRSGVFPRWFGWTGVALAVLCLSALAVGGVVLVLVLAWILLASGLMLGVGGTARPR